MVITMSTHAGGRIGNTARPNERGVSVSVIVARCGGRTEVMAHEIHQHTGGSIPYTSP